jgi:hypothetical protein
MALKPLLDLFVLAMIKMFGRSVDANWQWAMKLSQLRFLGCVSCGHRRLSHVYG